ncbi:protein FAM136A-like [Euwallacea similis]|uniref:protein FAM136A-like n=1 Tax=Euwallacea similis TaxID=1736056 RepID=UPI00344F8CD7
MVEEQRQRIEQEMTRMINELDLQYLRKMQADMHTCAATCCNNRDSSLEKVQKCVENCSGSLNWAQNYVQRELELLQNKLQRCVMDCNDNVRVQMGPNPNEDEVEKFTKIFENCATKCVDSQVNYIPSLLKKMKNDLESGHK